MNSSSRQTKRAFITGGTSGIGLAIAHGFSESVYDVVAAGIGDLPEPTDGINFRALDVRDETSVTNAFSGLNRLDVLVNAAGVIRRQEELQPRIFESVVDINLNGTMRTCIAARSLLAQSSGSIINTASMLSYFGGGIVPAYSTSKGGVVQLTKSLAIAFAGDGIRVNAIAPGWIETPMTQSLRDDPNRNQAIIDRTPLKRWGDPSELVGPALFLASASASFITGTVLNVDGGYAAM
jgi:NAD(P)-dependent dehydrogenase (short-subunit alcohol dehydrogenase family)